MTLKWIAGQLAMGSWTRVSQAVQRAQDCHAVSLGHLCERLRKISDTEQTHEKAV